MKEGYWSHWLKENRGGLCEICILLFVLLFVSIIFLFYVYIIMPVVNFLFPTTEVFPFLNFAIGGFILIGCVFIFMWLLSYRDYKKQKLIDKIKEEYPSIKKSM